MIGTLYRAYSEENIKVEKQPVLKEKIIDYLYNNISDELKVYQEASIGPQTYKYHLYGETEQTYCYFSALPYYKAIKLIVKDVKGLK